MWPPKSYAEITRVKAVGGVGSAKARGTADIDSAAVPTVSPELHPRSRYSSAMPFTCGECGAEAPDGSILCIYERGMLSRMTDTASVTIARFDRGWLSAGE